PTITYTPLVGERFSRSMLTPVPPAAVLSLIQAGNPVDVVLRLMVSVVNGIDNRYGGDLRAHPADAEFYALLERMRRVQLSGGIGMRVRRLERDEAVLMTFRQKVDPAVEPDIREIRQLLGLDPGPREFWIDDRDVPSKRMFSFIMFVFALVEPASKDAPPVLTIPAG